MSRYLLDTNVISEVIKPAPAPAVVHWMAEQRDEDLYIASMTLGEISRGIRALSAGKKRTALEKWFTGANGPQATFRNRILPFDEGAALIWAGLMLERESHGHPRGTPDGIIGAVALANDCVVVTGNEKDFAGVPLFNPWRP